MYIGVDFLLDETGKLYLSEVNTGVPAGATEFDLVHRARKGRPSDVFARIEAISRKEYGTSFTRHIHSLPWLDDLRVLKIWMDGRGPPPESPHPATRLEDKWVQYRLLSKSFPLIPTRVLGPDSEKSLRARMARGDRLVLKRRMTRGGRGLRILESPDQLDIPETHASAYVWQPYIASRLRSRALSIRAAAFAGQFLCMFASLAPRATSNHGTRFFIVPGERCGLTDREFSTTRVVGRSWEADIFYRGKIPAYLHQAVHEEDIAGADLALPEARIQEIRSLSARVSRLYSGLDFADLPPSCIEKPGAAVGR